MSSTNPEPGRDPVGHLAPTRPGSPSAQDTHGGSAAGGPTEAVIKRGYEEDRYDATSVLSVPVLVIVFFVLAFGTVTVLFRLIRTPGADPNAHPMAVERNMVPLDSRLDRIHRGGEVDQPRLEPLKMLNSNEGDPRAITRPPLLEGNSPELHADDIHPSPENTPSLYERGWSDPNKTSARITIDEAMRVALLPKNDFFKTQKPGMEPPRSTNIPTAANAGRGGESQAQSPAPGKKEEGKH
jgi:hypothetical protein